MVHLTQALLSVPGPFAYVIVAPLVFAEAAVFVGFLQVRRPVHELQPPG